MPLTYPVTVKCTMDTSGIRSTRSSTICLQSNQQTDDNSMTRRSTLPTTPLFRTLVMVTRTTTTRTTTTVSAPFADLFDLPHADFLFSDLVQAYFDCRKSKRNSKSALNFEINLENNIVELDEELRSGNYKPGKSLCFVITRPRPREVWAADFRDRVVHHLLYNKISPSIHARFIADSCACIPQRGTLYGVKRLERKARSITQDWSKPAYYLKCDLANFFVAINKKILMRLLTKHVADTWWRELAHQILLHNPCDDFEYRGSTHLLEKVPPHKRLTERSKEFGLPIGNLSSQFFANIYLNELDQFIKHKLNCKHYIRYVDDFVLLHECPRWLNNAKQEIEIFLQQALDAKLNPKKTILQPIHRGIDFAGQVIHPRGRRIRKRTKKHAIKRVREIPNKQLLETTNSYFALLNQTNNKHDKLSFAREVLRRGCTINSAMTKTFRNRKHHD